MGDQSAIMKAFNWQYEEWRVSVVSGYPGFKDLPPEEQEAKSKSGKHCFIHVHINQTT